MAEPWFARTGILNYRSLTWQGALVRTVTYSLMVLSIAVGFSSRPESPRWWISGFLGFGAFLIGHAIVLWKMDWGYHRH